MSESPPRADSFNFLTRGRGAGSDCRGLGGRSGVGRSGLTRAEDEVASSVLRSLKPEPGARLLAADEVFAMLLPGEGIGGWTSLPFEGAVLVLGLASGLASGALALPFLSLASFATKGRFVAEAEEEA